MEYRPSRRSTVAVVLFVAAVTATLASTVHARTFDLFGSRHTLPVPKLPFAPRFPTDFGKHRDQPSSSSTSNPMPPILTDDRLDISTQQPKQQPKQEQQQSKQEQQQSKQEQQQSKQEQQQPRQEQQLPKHKQQQQKLQEQQPKQQEQQATTEKPKLETTTQDRSIITAPLIPCPAGQSRNPDRVCRPNFVDPEDE